LRPGHSVGRISPRWQNTAADAKPPTLEPRPDNATPYVLHLNGCDRADEPAEVEHIALSEDDFLRKFVRLSRDRGQILPASIVTQLAQSAATLVGTSRAEVHLDAPDGMSPNTRVAWGLTTIESDLLRQHPAPFPPY